MKLLQTYTTDWLNSKPVFYNTKTNEVSLVMHDVVDWNNFEFDPEGLFNYLQIGYQIFGQTPIKDVKFLRHSSKISKHLDEAGKIYLSVEEFDDPVDNYTRREYSVEEAIDILKNDVHAFEAESKISQPNKRFLLPLSGGYDSRLLATFIEEKSRIDAFTYDISISEKYSFEVARAREVSRRLGIPWHQLGLTKYWNRYYQQKNFSAFCLEMPFHASYHMEMYDEIIKQFGHEYIALSGSVGDWWSGEKVPLKIPEDHLNFDSLFFNHGISIPKEFIKIKTDHEVKRGVYEDNIKRLSEDDIFKIVFARRGRIGLASYIYRTANLYFDVYTPFYSIDVAMSQLNLPKHQRKDRVWLRNFFNTKKLGIEDDLQKRLVVSNDYGIDLKTAFYTLSDSDLLDNKYFQGIIDDQRTEWINKELKKIKRIPFPLLGSTSRLFFGIDEYTNLAFNHSILGHGFDFIYKRLYATRDIFKAISEWTVLLPLQIAMMKRDNG